MKKIIGFVFVLVFVTLPVFADVSVSGELEYYMVSNADPSDRHSFADNVDKAEIKFNVDVGDYNFVSTEIELHGDVNDNDRNIRLVHAYVETDWGSLFGFKDINIYTGVGIRNFETFDSVDFTGFGYENADNGVWYDNISTGTDAGFVLDLGFLDNLIRLFYAMNFDTPFNNQHEEYNDAGQLVQAKSDYKSPKWFVGAGLDFDAFGLGIPLWLEIYYGSAWEREDSGQLGIEASYIIAIGEEMDIELGGFYMMQDNSEDYYPEVRKDNVWGFGVSWDGYGAAVGVSATGIIGESDRAGYRANGKDRNYGFAMLGIDAEYFILEWLGVNAGASLGFGDYAEDYADSVLQTFEVGVVLKGNSYVKYKLGYIYNAGNIDYGESTFDDLKMNTTGRSRTLNTDRTKTAAGGHGIYLSAVIDF